MNEKDHIKELFQSKLGGFRADVPEDGWEMLEETLASSSKTRILPRYWYAAAVVAALILGYVFVFRTPNRKPPVNVAESTLLNNEKMVLQDTCSQNESDKLSLLQNDKIVAHATVRSSKKSNTILKRTSNVKERTKVFSEIEYTHAKPDVTEKHINNKSSIFDKKTTSPHTSESSGEIFQKDTKQLVQEFIDAGRKAGLYAEAELTGKKGKHLTLAINNNSGLTSFSKTTNQPMSLRSSKKENIVNANGVNDADRFQFFPLEYSSVPYKVELEHKQPISFGLLLSKNLSRHIFVEAGLMYTYLSSKSKNNSLANSGQERQYIHYIGVPMNINYRLAALGALDFYFSLGGTLQKDVAGKFSYIAHTNNRDTKSLSEERKILNIKQKNPQFSLNTGIGLSYPLYSNLKLYGKFGGAYYFDAKNEYNTIYSEQKFALDVNVGLKIDF